MWQSVGMVFLFVALACSGPPPAGAPLPEPAPAELAPPPPAPAAAAGTIGGEPILDHPVVLGAISTEAVEAAVAARREPIGRCYAEAAAANPRLRGKVLVKFAITPSGAVVDAVARSSSLRHPGVESCVVREVEATAFPPLAGGAKAIVHYTFVFPPV